MCVIVSLPHRPTAHARCFNSADALAKLQAAGGSVAASAKECAAGADFVVTMLPSNATGARVPLALRARAHALQC